jgi:hypothetical protein
VSEHPTPEQIAAAGKLIEASCPEGGLRSLAERQAVFCRLAQALAGEPLPQALLGAADLLRFTLDLIDPEGVAALAQDDQDIRAARELVEHFIQEGLTASQILLLVFQIQVYLAYALERFEIARREGGQ